MFILITHHEISFREHLIMSSKDYWPGKRVHIWHNPRRTCIFLISLIPMKFSSHRWSMMLIVSSWSCLGQCPCWLYHLALLYETPKQMKAHHILKNFCIWWWIKKNLEKESRIFIDYHEITCKDVIASQDCLRCLCAVNNRKWVSHPIFWIFIKEWQEEVRDGIYFGRSPFNPHIIFIISQFQLIKRK